MNFYYKSIVRKSYNLLFIWFGLFGFHMDYPCCCGFPCALHIGITYSLSLPKPTLPDRNASAIAADA